MKGSRRGTSMVEILSVISVASIVVAIAASTLSLLLRWDSGVLRRTAEAGHQTRLALRLRDDAHDALRAEVAEAGDAARLSLSADRRVEYRVLAGGVERREMRGRDKPRVELYRLGRELSGRFQKVRERDRDFLQLEWSARPSAGRPAEQDEQGQFWAALPPAEGAP